MIEWTYIIIGAIISLIMIRLVKGIIREGLIMGLSLSLVEGWHFWFHPFLGFPELPIVLYQISSGVWVSWIIYRVWIILVSYSNRSSIMRKISKIVFGKVEKLQFK